MAKKKDSKDLSKKMHFWDEMRDETIQVILSIFSFLIVILTLLASFGKAGWIGDKSFTFFYKLFGVGYFLIPVMFVMLGISFLQSLKKRLEISRIVGALLFLISGLGIIHVIYPTASGIIGKLIASPLIKLVDYWATSTILVTILIVSIIMTFNLYFTLQDLMFWKKDTSKIDVLDTNKDSVEEIDENTIKDKLLKNATEEEYPEDKQKEKVKQNDTVVSKKKKSLLDFTDEEESNFTTSMVVPHLRSFTPPPLSLLEKDRGKPETGDIKANANIIKRTLQNFSISVEMDEISIGPSVTRYALKPAEGVKLSRIVGLNNDLALALAAHPIRIEAPIPGKSLVGIEVPNTAKTTVGLATLLSSPDYQESEKALLMSLGKDITGRAHFSNLAKAPHMLIAGTTGSGKSVTIHALVTSLLYRNSPQNLKFIMIDPKRVELTMYNKIPHLLTPVITDPKKAILALKWAAKEMSRRYDVLEQNKSRDIDSYHKSILAPALEKAKSNKPDTDNVKLPESMPYIAIFIDELADIMQTYPRELEAAIVRLAQMSRAVGIHLIISTQRPSVNVITGLIKANIPSRIALQVSSQIDSRTILDQMGAEKLLGAGDMLYLGGEMSKPIRLQSAYISESEVKRVVKYLIDEYKDQINDEINLTPTEPGSTAAFDSMLEEESIEDDDEYYEPVRTEVINSRKASTSYIQRKFGIGYSRAAKLIDTLEKRGVVGPANGSKPREVLIGSSSTDDTVSSDTQNPTTEDTLV